MEFWYSAIRAVEALRVPYNGALLLINAARNAAVAESAVESLHFAAKYGDVSAAKIAEAEANAEAYAQAAWEAVCAWSLTLPPEVALKECGRLNGRPTADIVEVEAVHGGAVGRFGDSNARGYTYRDKTGRRIELPLKSDNFKAILAAGGERAVSWYTKEKGYPIQYGFVASCSEETLRLLLQEVAATPAVIPYHEQDCFILRDPEARALYEAAHVVWTGE